MSKWIEINEEYDVPDLVHNVDWADSFLNASTLFHKEELVLDEGAIKGVKNWEVAPNGWIGILAYIESDYQYIEFALSKIKLFCPPIYLEDIPQIIFNSAVLVDNKEIKVSFSNSSNMNIICKKMAIRTTPIDETEKISSLLNVPKTWAVINSPFSP